MRKEKQKFVGEGDGRMDQTDHAVTRPLPEFETLDRACLAQWAMLALLTTIDKDNNYPCDELAKKAVHLADDLIAELEKDPVKHGS